MGGSGYRTPCYAWPLAENPVGIQPLLDAPPHVEAAERVLFLLNRTQTSAGVTRPSQPIHALSGQPVSQELVGDPARLDPHTAAELDLDQTCNLVDDLMEAHGDGLPEYI